VLWVFFKPNGSYRLLIMNKNTKVAKAFNSTAVHFDAGEIAIVF